MQIKEEAIKLWEKGCNVVLVKGKKPVHKFEEWMHRRQTKEELLSLPFDQADGIAVIQGMEVEKGYYLCCLDLDVKNLSADVVERGKRIIASLPATYTERSPSGGLHLFFLSREKPKTVVNFREKCGIELLGEGRLTNVYPSPGYTVEKALDITKVDSINKLFMDALKREGIAEERQESWFNRRDIKPRSYRGNDPPCIQWIKMGAPEGKRNEYAIRYCSYLVNFRGVEPEKALEMVREWNQKNNPPLSEKELRSTLKSAFEHGYTYGCSDPILSSLCNRENCPLHKEDRGIDPEVMERWKNENMLELVHKVLSRTIKRDDHVKLLVFLTALSAYSDSPINLFLKGESGSGKSYITKEVLKLFPESDVSSLGMLSPKALIHEQGTLMADGESLEESIPPIKPYKRDFKSPEEYQKALEAYERAIKEYREKLKRSYKYINFNQKIIAFLEIPDQETFRILYSLLSHDKERIEYKFTDKTEKGTLMTRRVIVEGWPATIFCSTDRKYIEELATRSLTVTPETSQDKIRDAMSFLAKKASSLEDGEDDPDTIFLKKVIEHIKMLSREYTVKIPFEELDKIFPKDLVRHMRDFGHFLDLIKAITMLYIPQREIIEANGKKYVLANIDDVLTAYVLYMRIKETTETGTEENIIRFYYDVILQDKNKEWSVRELMEAYRKTYNITRSQRTIERWLSRLRELGYVTSRPDPSDRRQKLWSPMKSSEMSPFMVQAESLIPILENSRERWKKNNDDNIPLRTERNFVGGGQVIERKRPLIQLPELKPKEKIEKAEIEKKTEEKLEESEEKEESIHGLGQSSQKISTQRGVLSSLLSGKIDKLSGENKPKDVSSYIKGDISAGIDQHDHSNVTHNIGDGHAPSHPSDFVCPIEKSPQKDVKIEKEGTGIGLSNSVQSRPEISPSDSNDKNKEWEELNKRLLEYAKRARESGPLPACKYCAFWQGDENSWLGKCIKTDSITNREYSCEKYVWKNEVMKRKEAVEEMVHRSTYYEKIKELGNGWTAYGLPAGKDYRCSICGEKA
ncbi:bifunctional DNA primase/polymerase, partial [Candidatus Methanodesulfokora washburnensis]